MIIFCVCYPKNQQDTKFLVNFRNQEKKMKKREGKCKKFVRIRLNEYPKIGGTGQVGSFFPNKMKTPLFQL